ncbi:uncharacterized protein LOC126674840 [Mercurialis annua]|uniref:uncharacterized protein LOC126674840 n=1 Tax=Mercurialis annua TaxID=3986 RepID=UPI00215E0164|nr:uncharacterized protein LOC126674840 [Mercurialis annua]
MNLPVTTPKPNTINVNPTLITTTTPTTTTGATCGNCNTKETFLLHHVRVRGVHRRLCTSCVLRAHPSSFCPNCFTFYDINPPPPAKRIACSNCTSFTHSHCAAMPPPSHSPFLCPPCVDPNFNFFSFSNSDKKAIDKKMATVLLCAAKIASNSMAKAVNVARLEAERRVKEAAVCKKRAREALEHVMLIAKRKEADGVSGSGNHVLGKRDRDGVDGVVVAPATNGNLDLKKES